MFFSLVTEFPLVVSFLVRRLPPSLAPEIIEYNDYLTNFYQIENNLEVSIKVVRGPNCNFLQNIKLFK